MNILLIAGHGAGDPGACGCGLKEANETRAMANAIGAELKRRGISYGCYPQERNAYKDCCVGLFKTYANLAKYSYVLELHFNANKADGGDGKTKGVECYVTSAENGTGVENAICSKVAALGLTNRGVKRKDYAVIRSCKSAGVSAALLEICFIDDADDVKIYTRSREAVAKAIVDGICSGFGIKEVSAVANDMEQAKKLALSKGIIKGDEKGDPMWDKPVTREQLVTILYRMGLLK